MSGRMRNTSKRQADRQIVRQQSGFIGGMNLDKPTSEIQVNELANLENMRAFLDRLETRSGTEKQANLPGSGTFHNYFYHQGNKQHIIHRGDRLHIADNISSGFTEAVGSKFPLDAPSNIVAFGKNIAIFQGSEASTILEFEVSVTVISDVGEDDSSLSVCELRNTTGGFYNRSMNAPNPDVPLDIKNPSNETGPYIYRYLYSFVRQVDEILLAESGTIVNSIDSDPNYTEITFNEPITSSNAPFVDTFVEPTEGEGTPLDDTQWTGIRIYRTLDIGDQGSGDAETYYLVDTIDFADIVDPTNTILEFEVSVSVILDEGAGLGASDTAILFQGNISKTRFVVPIPGGLIGAVSPSFIFVAADSEPDLFYSSTGDVPERAGYFFPGNQFQQLDDGIRAIKTSPNTVVVLCNSSTFAGSTQSIRNAGEQGLGQSIPLLNILTSVDENIGVTDVGSISDMDTGRFVAHCSDDSIRIFNGLSWDLRDWARNKVSNELKKIVGGSVGLYSPEGYYRIWYRTDVASIRTTRCLRLGMDESVGIGWNEDKGASWIFPPLTRGAVRTYDNAFNKLQLLVLDDADGIIFWIDTYDGGTGSGLIRRRKDKNLESNEANIACKIEFGEITGDRESFLIIHQESHFNIRPLLRNGTFPSSLNLTVNLYKDDIATAQSTFINLDSDDFDKDIQFDREVQGKRIRLELVSDEQGFILVAYQTIARVQDRRISMSSSTFSTFNHQLALATNLVFDSERPDPTRNGVKTVASGEKNGTNVGTAPTRVTGKDNQPNTAFSFTGS